MDKWINDQNILDRSTSCFSFWQQKRQTVFQHFDHENTWIGLQYLIRNVALCLNLKMVEESSQSKACNLSYIQNTRRYQSYQTFHLLHLIAFHPWNILHFMFTLNHFILIEYFITLQILRPYYPIFASIQFVYWV